MDSLAFLVAAIVVTVLLLGAVATTLSAIGILAMVAAGSLGWRVPQAWAIWLPPLLAGVWAFWRGRE